MTALFEVIGRGRILIELVVGPDLSFDTLVTQELSTMNTLLSELPSNALKVEVLENLFSLIFVTHRDLQQSEEVSDEENDADSSSRYDSSEQQQNGLRSDGFLASKKFISALLTHLNTQIRSTKVKVTDDRALQSRLEELLKHVVDARWRLEIVEEKLLVSIKCVQNIECDGEILKQLHDSRRSVESLSPTMLGVGSSPATVIENELKLLRLLLRLGLYCRLLIVEFVVNSSAQPTENSQTKN